MQKSFILVYVYMHTQVRMQEYSLKVRANIKLRWTCDWLEFHALQTCLSLANKNLLPLKCQSFLQICFSILQKNCCVTNFKLYVSIPRFKTCEYADCFLNPLAEVSLHFFFRTTFASDKRFYERIYTLILPCIGEYAWHNFRVC